MLALTPIYRVAASLSGHGKKFNKGGEMLEGVRLPSRKRACGTS